MKDVSQDALQSVEERDESHTLCADDNKKIHLSFSVKLEMLCSFRDSQGSWLQQYDN
jgi:hypothetical protein